MEKKLSQALLLLLASLSRRINPNENPAIA